MTVALRPALSATAREASAARELSRDFDSHIGTYSEAEDGGRKIEEAIIQLQEALRISPNYAGAHDNLS